MTRKSETSARCRYDRWGGCGNKPIWLISTVKDGYDYPLERGRACAKHLNPILQGLAFDEFVLDRIAASEDPSL